MNKRHYEHTLPNIRGSLSNTYDKIHYRDISQQQQLADDTEYSECCFHAYMIELLTSG